MRKILRTTVVALAATAAVAGGSPASANPGAGHSSGNGGVRCFGCGVSTGTVQLAFTGVYNGYTAVNEPALATLTVNEPAETCPVSGTASGTVTGRLNLTFTWTRLGALLLVTTSGDVNGASVLTMVPLGASLCGGPVTFNVQGVIVGT